MQQGLSTKPLLVLICSFSVEIDSQHSFDDVMKCLPILSFEQCTKSNGKRET